MTRQEIVPERLAGATAVVIDVFMATTTLLTILENGARDVYPVATWRRPTRSGRSWTSAAPARRRAGRGADRGYDHGPFPEEYAPEVVGGKT